MLSCFQNNNMKFMTPVLIFTCIFCAFPEFKLKDPLRKRAKILKKLNKIFAVLCLAFWIIVGLGAVYKVAIEIKKLRLEREVQLIPVAMMGLLVQCVLATFSFMITVSFGFMYPKSIHKLFKNLDQVDFILAFKLGKARWQFYLHFFIFCFVQIVHGYYNFSLWHSTLEPSIFRIFAIRILQIFQFSLVVFITNTLCLHLYQRFKRLNRLLKKFDPYHDSMESRLHVDIHHKYFMFKELKKIHSLLCDQVDSVNDIFGLLLLCFIITAIVMICYFVVHVLTMIIYYVNFSQTQKIHLLVVCSSGITFITIEVISLAWIGALLSSETTKTHKIAYALLNTLSHRNQQTEPEQLFRKELKSLAIQSGFRQPYVSTNGIFKVDFSILGAVIGSVTSYIIVAQQFLHPV